MKPSPRQLVIAIAFAAIVLATTVGTASSAIKQGDGTFTVDIALSRPTTTGPANGSTLTYPSDPTKLTWRGVPGATSYEVQVAQQSNANIDCNSDGAWQSENVLFTHTTSDLGWVPELTSEETGSKIWTGTFCWRVRAAGKTPGTWSSSPRFAITWPATASNLRFYSDENGDVPRSGAADSTGFDTGYLEWNAVDGASRYEVQISESSTFSAASLFATKTWFGSRMLLPQMPNNNYTWRVRPVAGNGVRGNWSSPATFTIQRDSRYWTSDLASLYPTQGGTVDDLRFGWEPVPGASYYRYQVATDATSFTELDNMAPFGAVGNNCSPTGNSRISANSEARSSTINNWATFGAIVDDEVNKNLRTWCERDLDGDGPGTATNWERPNLPSTVYWRVYPVWQLSSETETGWDVDETKIIGSAVLRSFQLDPYDAAATDDNTIGKVDGTHCRDIPYPDPGIDCLRLIGGSMSPKNSSINSATMQVPVFTWGAYPGGNAPTDGEGPGSFRVQVARDPEFDNQVLPTGAGNLIRGWISTKGPLKRDERAGDSLGQSLFGQVNRSFALTTGLPDEGQEDGNGYFWRAIPCQSGTDGDHISEYLCEDYYSERTEANLWSDSLAYGNANSGALQFQKRVEVSTGVIADFAGTVPMLRVGPVGASSFQQWQTGIQGADHYEFELARNQAFTDSKVLETTVPRIVPWGATPADPLEPGTWYWRVRAIDRDGLAGTWSAASSFAINAQAPTPSASSTTSGVGGLVEWSRVPGAISYEVAWSKSATFSSGTKTATTAQAAYFIPSSAPGAYKWRVRAKTGDESFGPWSSAKDITILAPTRISYGLSASKVRAGGLFIAEAKLLVAGSAKNNQIVQLQRKNTSCTTSGRYVRIASARTGKQIDDGFVRMRVRAARSFCYRFVWPNKGGAVYSASFEVKVLPVVSARVLNRSVSRGKAYCMVITSRQALYGRLRVQYKVGRAWVTARTQMVRAMKRRRQCAVINRGGVFSTRVVFDNLKNPGRRYKMYDTVVANTGLVRVADRFVVVRSHRR